MTESFGRLLQRHRLAAGLSQENLAELAGVSTNAIGSLERGLRHAPHSATLDLLIAALKLDDDSRAELEKAARLARIHRAQAQGLDNHSDLPNAVALNNLPPQLTSFVDRKTEVAEIKELLQSHRLVTVVGTGGAGKSRCAMKIGTSMLDTFPDGVWVAELVRISDPALVSNIVARALKVQEAPNCPMLDTLLAYLKRKRLLLMIDNCEHVIEEARNVIAAILRECPDVRILATSRESLNIAGEHVYRMPSLPVPSDTEILSANEISQYGAVQLFSDRASAADNRFTLTIETAAHVADICRRLDGIPLAIELAAARVATLSAKELAQKLDERFRVLTGGDRSGLPRHRTMRALIDWSYDLLTDDECRLFRKLSIFAGGFTLETATAVCGGDEMDEIAIVDLLSSLVDKSLVQVDIVAGDTRYHFLESTRQYAREKLRDAGEEKTTAHDHARAFLDVAEQLSEAWEIPPDRDWNARSEPELENFRAALSWAFAEHGDALLGQRLITTMRRVWYAFAPAEGWRWLQIAQHRASESTPAAVMAALDLAECGFSLLLDRYTPLRPAEQALARYRDLGDPYGIALAEMVLGGTLIRRGNIVDGETLVERSLQAMRALGVRKSLTLALQVSGNARMLAGDFLAARQRFREALAIAEAFGGETYAYIARCLAELEFRDGDTALALQLADATLARPAAPGDTFQVASVRRNKAAYLVALHRFDEARAAARAVVNAAWNIQSPLGQASILQHLAAIGALRPSADAPVIEDRRRAATILGYVNARLAALNTEREHTDRQEYDAMIPVLRDALGEDELARLMSEGARFSEDQAVAEAMLI